MGPYLGKPITTINTSDDENSRFCYCTAEMQGWRRTQEDAHAALLNYDDKGSAFFAVFDGHGGDEVAKYCSLLLPDFIKNFSSYKEGRLEEALRESFLKFDQSLKETKVINELKRISEKGSYLEPIEEEEAVILKKEAQMPLDQVLQASTSSDEDEDFKPNNGDSNDKGIPKPNHVNDQVEKITNLKAEGSSEEATKEPLKEESSAQSSSSQIEENVATKDELEKMDEDVKQEQDDKTASNEDTNNKHDVKQEKNGEVKDEKVDAESNHKQDELSQPSTSKMNKSIRKPSNLHSKSMIMRVINKTIYESFISDFQGEDDDDDDDDDEEEILEDDDDEEEEDEDDSEGEEDSDEDSEEAESDDEDDDEEEVDDAMYTTPGVGSGCTAIVALARGNQLYVANVGDSRCVLCRDGVAIELSEDHKPEDEKEKTRIVNAGGEITPDGRVNGGLNLSRAIGDHLYKNNADLPAKDQMITAFPDIRVHEIDPEKDQFFFLACDGIWNSMSSQEVVDFINDRLRHDVSLKSICEQLFHACLAPNTLGDGSGCDNMTCVLVRLKSASEPKRQRLDDSTEDSVSVSKKVKTSDESEISTHDGDDDTERKSSSEISSS